MLVHGEVTSSHVSLLPYRPEGIQGLTQLEALMKASPQSEVGPTFHTIHSHSPAVLLVESPNQDIVLRSSVDFVYKTRGLSVVGIVIIQLFQHDRKSRTSQFSENSPELQQQ
jgi:hypothetical protein